MSKGWALIGFFGLKDSESLYEATLLFVYDTKNWSDRNSRIKWMCLFFYNYSDWILIKGTTNTILW